MTLRKVLLKVHLYLGLAAALFLLILGVTGSIMAFEGDIEHWMHPEVWYVTAGGQRLPREELIRRVEEKLAPAKVAMVQMGRQPNMVDVMQLSTGTAVPVNPYDGSITGTRNDDSKVSSFLRAVHQVHLRLATTPRAAWGKVGKMVINYAGLILMILVPTGMILWFRAKRASIKFGVSWFRICFDVHHVVGLYAAIFLFVAAVTGVLIGFDWGEGLIYKLVPSEKPAGFSPPQSTLVPGAGRISVDQAIDVARRAIPNATVSGVMMPKNPEAAYDVLMRVPEEVTDSVHSYVFVDQYSGKVLFTRNFETDSQGYRWVRFNRAIHTGDIWGTPTHVLMSLSSLMLVAMVLTGLVIWWKKLAV